MTSTWRDAIEIYAHPRVVAIAFLGFSAGLPFLLVFSTLSAWLTEYGVSRSTIGFFSWIGITYSVKVFWAPVVDRLRLPFLTDRLGQRRSWMLVAQLGIVAGLLGMAYTDPSANLEWIAVFGLVVAFSSATQDITIDAYRIEAVEKARQAAMAAAYIFGYRVALLVAGAGALYIAAFASWPTAYLAMAATALIGVVATLVIREPERALPRGTAELEARAVAFARDRAHWPEGARRAATWFVGAVVCPFLDFFDRNGARLALLLLALVGAYRISDITMGVMANPFYLDLGFTKTQIADIVKIFGFGMTLAGSAFGGVAVVKWGLARTLLLGAALVAVTNLLFALMAGAGPNPVLLAAVISADNFSGGLANVAFIAFLSSLTNTTYTATQYALFSSLMTLPGKFIGGYAGIVVDQAGFGAFFLYAGALGAPAIALVYLLMRRHPELFAVREETPAASGSVNAPPTGAPPPRANR